MIYTEHKAMPRFHKYGTYSGMIHIRMDLYCIEAEIKNYNPDKPKPEDWFLKNTYR